MRRSLAKRRGGRGGGILRDPGAVGVGVRELVFPSAARRKRNRLRNFVLPFYPRK